MPRKILDYVRVKDILRDAPLRKAIATPLAVTTPLQRNLRQAIETKRLGNVSADRGLDTLAFFLADVQTGFGPFIAVYLAANNWTAAEIGTALGVGTIVTMATQLPAGAAIDAVQGKRLMTLTALLAVFASAVLLALWPYWIPVLGAEVLHGIASSLLVPAVAAVTLSRVGRATLARRLGRNARFMAVGNGIGAVLMGFVGARIAVAAPFWLASASVVPAMLALWALPPRHETEPPAPRIGARKATAEGWRVLRSRGLLIFVVCVVLFHSANAFILPLALQQLTARIGNADTNMIVAACLVVAQAMVALISPFLGSMADRWGRRRVLLIGFATVPLHAGLLVLFDHPYWIVGLQLLDGMGGAMFGVLQPLVASDVAQGTNRFNLCIGTLGLAAGLGGTLSSVAGGHIATQFGNQTAFLALAAAGVIAVLAVALFMPETKKAEPPRTFGPQPADQPPDDADPQRQPEQRPRSQ